MRIFIVQPALHAVSETFLAAHATHLPGQISVLHHSENLLPVHNERYILPQGLGARAIRKMTRSLTGKPWEWERTKAYISAFRKFQPDVVLAEYGPTGVWVSDACKRLNLPLVVHFHGCDASQKDILSQHVESYKDMFQQAAGVVAVSHAMRDRLLTLGAVENRLHLNHYGVDVSKFNESTVPTENPTFLAVGRFVEKKAPYLTILAFSNVVKKIPNAQLKFIGDGPLLGVCQDLTKVFAIERSVNFLGSQPHDVVAREMKSSLAFVQHSIEASNGDCEGTPNCILEAGACGLPVVSTWHAGIPDVVIDSETGFLVKEKDVEQMSERMVQLASDPRLARRFGMAARKRVLEKFSMQNSIHTLANILSAASNKESRLK
ncbi:glycosyltransferase [Thalassoglobus sp.]|uniref:glycosyltransferase n=1 Tax=Thalassoglobus sp. TaxID=2795869 RepID=UPI003AA8385B